MSGRRFGAGTLLEAVSAGAPFAALDLGTTHAKALVAQFGPASTWNVVGAAGVGYTDRHGAQGPALAQERERGAVEALAAARRRCLALSGRSLAPPHCAVAVPNDAVTLVSHRRETARRRPDREIAAGEARSLALQATSANLRQARQTMQGLGKRPVWLGQVWSACTVDGQAVTNMVGFRGSAVAVETVQAFAAAAAVEPLRRWARAHDLVPTLLPEALAAAELARRRPACLLIDAGGQRTDVYLRTVDGRFRHLWLPLGGHYFSRWLSLNGGLAPATAERLKLAYAAGRLRPRGHAKVQAVMLRAFAVWAERLAEALASAATPIPRWWLATGGHSLLPESRRLPGALADASMTGLERYPDLEPLTLADVSTPLVAGPETLQPGHSIAFGLAQYAVRLTLDDEALALMRRAAILAAWAGFEVSSEWLSS